MESSHSEHGLISHEMSIGGSDPLRSRPELARGVLAEPGHA